MTDKVPEGGGSPSRPQDNSERRKLPPPIDPSDSPAELIKAKVAGVLAAQSAQLTPTARDELTEQLTATMVTVTQEISFSGPLPPPNLLGAYESIVPGLAKTIVEMSVKEQNHRHIWELRALWNSIFAQSGGLFLGWITATLSIAAAFYFFEKGNNWAGSIFLGVPVATIVQSMVNAHRQPSPKGSLPEASQKPSQSTRSNRAQKRNAARGS
ncbi:DUF2335 domain-containing protein [Teichococcus aestuarii]|uniref:DUF2335 domain-containing protein n=1 Tax=Teichococcus aestuarii TaxID=568898 RepID=A0A2U1UXN8_9PROT|nr:DUF2335 domain-containing protein [Pseudoroseomonas aestuarii]PWC26398.1 hypothetical protein CR165_23475 [Pseudoroseomonas aestuarii]